MPILLMSLLVWLTACSNSSRTRVCKGLCTTTADCSQELICDTLGTKECVQCLTDDDCPFVGGCDAVSGRCNKMCMVDGDCIGIMTGKCRDSLCNGCVSDADCGYPGSTDIRCGPKGTCGKSCTTDADCWIGFRCTSGECSCTDNASCVNALPDSTLTWICE